MEPNLYFGIIIAIVITQIMVLINIFATLSLRKEVE